MPKLKTNRAAAKRIRKTAKGYKAYSAGRRHNLGHKDPQAQASSAIRWQQPRGRERCRPSAGAAPESLVISLTEKIHGTSQAWCDGASPPQ